MNIDLKFQDWSLVLQSACVRQYDDNVHRICVTGGLPEGWSWKLHIAVFGEAYFNAIPLTEGEGALSALLTRDDLAFGDTTYTLQLVGERDDARRHTNPVRLYVGASLSGDGVWPEVPRSFTDSQHAAEAAAAAAQEAAARAEQAADDVAADTEDSLLGSTPLTLAEEADVVLRSASETSYTAKTNTFAVADLLNGTNHNTSVADNHGVIALRLLSTAPSGWYNAYLSVTITGLEIGRSYNLVCNSDGITYDSSAHESHGVIILYDHAGGTQLWTSSFDNYTHEFTAAEESVYLRWYPSGNSGFTPGESVAKLNGIYLNEPGTTDLNPVFQLSGTFTGSTTLRSIPSGATITADPSCAVYALIGKSETEKPLYGKNVVCFGDSLFGLHRGSTSAPAVVADLTGATVYNVGFGGCRMSDHPDNGYAAFSMWALAKAIAENDWATQDAQASSGSAYFPEQLALLKSIDFSEVDYAVIHYGTNDFGGGVAIGEDSPATVHNTICGALRYSIETLLGAYPNLRIFVSLPVLRRWTVDGQTEFSDTHLNSRGKTLIECSEAMMRVSREYNCPIIDGYHGLGINKINVTTFYEDNAHHNEAGRRRFGAYIAEKLVSGGENGAAHPAALPAVTSADNGKFLRVADGVYTLAAVPAAEGSVF